MTTIVSVHGTFAQTSIDANGQPVISTPEDSPWWWQGSAFEQHMRQLISGKDGQLDFLAFEWNAGNSERERRREGARLFQIFKDLEDRGQTYCAIGHSHGGSVISYALMESINRNVELKGLRRWITVGTPFVEMRKERFLFTRLPLILQAMFIASMMLLFMFVFSVVGDITYGRDLFGTNAQITRLLISAGLVSIPFALFYLVAKLLDGRKLWFYRRSTMQEAHHKYAGKWMSLTHDDDEAVRGLGSLRAVNLNIFDRSFAVSTFSVASVFVLPLLFLYLVFSPTWMTGLADYLASNVYGISDFARIEQTYEADRKKIRTIRKKIRALNDKIGAVTLDTSKTQNLQIERNKLRKTLLAARNKMRIAHPDITQTHRAARFKKRFLEIDGNPCPGNRLCHGGRDYALNSGLLFHLVTDEFSSWFIDEDVRASTVGRIFTYAVPIILVPIVFGLFAVAFVLSVQFLAWYFSYLMSSLLDRLTWSQVRRSALGNDTETEIAVSAHHAPSWISAQRTVLPREVANAITTHSNHAMGRSIWKIRDAISELAFADGHETKAEAVLKYLNWQELIHMAYFKVYEFRILLAVAISQLDEFAANQPLLDDPQYELHDQWLNSTFPATGRQSPHHTPNDTTHS